MKHGTQITRGIAASVRGWLALLYLNHAAYRAWLARGPPTENPAGWMVSAGNMLAWSLAFISAAIGTFITIGKLPAINRRAVAFMAAAASLAAVPCIREFISADEYLDTVGIWSSEQLRCLQE